MIVTIYHRPHGRPDTLEITNVAPEDAAWFEANSVKISMEEDGMPGDPNFIIYADIGLRDEDGDPIELIELSGCRSCEETLAALRQQCETYKLENA